MSSWGTTPNRARMRGPSVTGFMPSTRSSPPVIGETQAIMRIVEVLPAPFGPRNPNASPGSTCKSIPATATKSPNRLVSPRPSISGPAAFAATLPSAEPGVRRSWSGSADGRWGSSADAGPGAANGVVSGPYGEADVRGVG